MLPPLRKLCIVGAAVSVIALMSTRVPIASSEDAAVPVGVLLPMSGQFARYGELVRNGILSAAPSHAELIFEDEACDAARAVRAFNKLTKIDGARIFLGPSCGSPQRALAPIIGAGGFLAVLGSSAPEAVHRESKGRMLSVQHSLEAESRFMAHAAYERGARRIAIVFFDNEFSRAHEAAFRPEFRGDVAGTIAYSSADAADMKGIAIKVRRLNVDSLYLPDAAPFMHGLLRELHQANVRETKIFSVYSAHSRDVLTAAGELAEGMVFSYPNIGDADALEYFPRTAAEILDQALSACPAGGPDCVHAELLARREFDESGVLRGELGLKTVRGGEFVWLDS